MRKANMLYGAYTIYLVLSFGTAVYFSIDIVKAIVYGSNDLRQFMFACFILFLALDRKHLEAITSNLSRAQVV